MDSKFYVITFYKLVELENYYDMKEPMLDVCKDLGMKGTVILSEEGISLTVCCPSLENLDMFVSFLKTDDRLADLPEYCLTRCHYEPFLKMIVRLKLGVVNMGSFPVDMHYSGEKVDAETWDKLVSSEEVSVIDVRNDYEGRIGTFNRAIVPDEPNFARFPDWWNRVKESMNKKLAIFCTGGIRCEKAGAWLVRQGYEVYNLDGGILHYLEQRVGREKTWHGDCFLFDDRVVVDGELQQNARCTVCGKRPSVEDLRSVSRADVVCSYCSGRSDNSVSIMVGTTGSDGNKDEATT